MNEFLANNWFSILAVLAFLGGTAVNVGMSRQRGIQQKEAVTEVKTALKEETGHLEKYFKDEIALIDGRTTANANAIQLHINNSEAHVTGMFLELLKTRHEFVSQQLTDARSDIGRIEGLLNKS